MFGIPESTLRDRFRGVIPYREDGLPQFGPDPTFSEAEEIFLVEYIQYMNTIGYSYSCADIKSIATEFAVYLKKKLPSEKELSQEWYNRFTSRYPDIRQYNLQSVRKIIASNTIHSKFYLEFESLLNKYSLLEEPNNIYIFDDIILPVKQPSSSANCDEEDSASSDGGETNSFSLIGCGNASGSIVPPYFVVPGKKWNDQYLEGCCYGSDGESTEFGRVNPIVVRHFFEDHFRKFVPLGNENKPNLILYDGHRFHLLLILKFWAQENNVVFFVIPPPASSVSEQDRDCFSPVLNTYRKESRIKLNANSSIAEILKLGSNAYVKSIVPSVLPAVFRKLGLFPFNLV